MKTRIVVTVVALLATLTLCGQSPAQAHTNLVSTSPEAGSTIAALPEQLELTFDEPLLQTGGGANEVIVTDPMKETISAASANIDGATISTVLSPTMVMSGTYKVAFRVVAGDGHVVEGSWTFDVDPKAGSRSSTASAVPVPSSGAAMILAGATGAGVTDGVGSANGSAEGTFDIDFATATMCYRIATSGLKTVTAVHIHSASMENMTISDEIYLPVDVAAVDAAAPVCTKQDPQSLAVVANDPSHFVMMLHTVDFPDGAVAGPLTLAPPVMDPSSTPRAAVAGLVPPSDGPSFPGLWVMLGVLVLGLAVAGRVSLRSNRRTGRTGPRPLSPGEPDHLKTSPS